MEVFGRGGGGGLGLEKNYMKRVKYASPRRLFVELNSHIEPVMKTNQVTALIVYADDIVLLRNDPAEMEKWKRQLSKVLEIEDSRKFMYFIGELGI